MQVCVMHACGSLLCHGEEGWRKKTGALNKNVFIFKREGEALSSICLPPDTPLEDFSSLKSTTEGEREGGTEREVQLRETASQSCEAEVMDSAHRKVTVFS